MMSWTLQKFIANSYLSSCGKSHTCLHVEKNWKVLATWGQTPYSDHNGLFYLGDDCYLDRKKQKWKKQLIIYAWYFVSGNQSNKRGWPEPHINIQSVWDFQLIPSPVCQQTQVRALCCHWGLVGYSRLQNNWTLPKVCNLQAAFCTWCRIAGRQKHTYAR